MSTDGRRVGRPRSEAARTAVLDAVDDLLVEVGYAAMTMKGIAERAGVSRQTVYRWWSTKAEILVEAVATDAADDLTLPPADSPTAEVTAYLEALVAFLTRDPAGVAYRALVGEAQHDRGVAALLAARDVLGDSARAVLERALEIPEADVLPACTDLVGPVFFAVLTGRDPAALDVDRLAARFLRAWSANP